MEEKKEMIDVSEPSAIKLDPEGESIPASLDDDSKKISKKEMKRRLKAENWEKIKAQKRLKEKEKRKKRKSENPSNTTITRKKLKETTMASSSCKVKIVVDLSFENYMDDKSIGKCIKQVQHCYSINRRAENPVQFHLTSLVGKCLKELEKHQGFSNWDVNFNEHPFTKVFDHEKIVYLTSESENIIEKMEDDKVYVIGGLVDHNSHKGLCHRLAVERKLNHGRLPLEQYIDLKTRKVLTIDHETSVSNLFHILVNVCNGQNWKDAFLQVIPLRKGAKEAAVDDTLSNKSEELE